MVSWRSAGTFPMLTSKSHFLRRPLTLTRTLQYKTPTVRQQRSSISVSCPLDRWPRSQLFSKCRWLCGRLDPFTSCGQFTLMIFFACPGAVKQSTSAFLSVRSFLC